MSLNYKIHYCYLSRLTKDSEQFAFAGAVWPWIQQLLPKPILDSHYLVLTLRVVLIRTWQLYGSQQAVKSTRVKLVTTKLMLIKLLVKGSFDWNWASETLSVLPVYASKRQTLIASAATPTIKNCRKYQINASCKSLEQSGNLNAFDLVKITTVTSKWNQYQKRSRGSSVNLKLMTTEYWNLCQITFNVQYLSVWSTSRKCSNVRYISCIMEECKNNYSNNRDGMLVFTFLVCLL